MANPPITIGSFDNVPAPGSPLKSDWPQEISTYTQRLPRGQIAAAQGTAVAGVGTTVTDIPNSSVTWTAAADRRYRISVQSGRLDQFTATGQVEVHISDGANAMKLRAWQTLAAGQFGGITFAEFVSGLSGSITRKARLATSAGTVTVQQTTWLVVEDLGSTTALPT